MTPPEILQIIEAARAALTMIPAAIAAAPIILGLFAMMKVRKA